MDDDRIVYEGQERRKEIRLYQCDCHTKHTQILSDLTNGLKEVKNDAKEAKLQSTVHHGEMWNVIREKLGAKVALVFLTAFTLAYVFGVLSVHKGVQANKIALISNMSEIRIEMTKIAHDLKDVKRELNIE